MPLTGSIVTNLAHHFTCDPAGNIASKQVESSGTTATMTTYSHNSLNQVTAIGGTAGPMPVIVRGDTNEPATVEVKSGASGSTWKDARMLAGNRFESDLDLAAGANAIDVRATDGSSNVANYTYSLTLAAATAATPAFDADGNMTSDGVRGYEWDFMSRLVKVTWGGSPVLSTEYRYNALGQRSERIEKSGTTETAHYYYLYQGIRLLCRYQGGTAATNIDRQYLSQGEQRKISSAWSSYYYNRDHLGCVREVMNADGTLAARYDYTPYGVRRVQYESTAYAGGCDLGFTGHIMQLSPVSGQTELVLTHFRGYDPELGRWLSADPIGEEGGLNLYGYVEGDPLQYFDPLGLDPECNLNPHSLDADGRDKWGTDWGRANYENYSKKIVPKPGLYQVVAHGDPRSMFDDRIKGERRVVFITDLITLFQKINPDKWEKSTEIKLHSCSTGKGENSLAQVLADLSGRTVTAPTDTLNTDGTIADGGKWKQFSPRKVGERPSWIK